MGGAIKSFFGMDSQPVQQQVLAPPPPPPPSMADTSVQDAERRARLTAASSGRASTMLTGGEGVTDKEEQVSTAKKYLLGT